LCYNADGDDKMDKIITYVTGNWAKIDSAKQILEPLGYKIDNIKMETPEIQANDVVDVAKTVNRVDNAVDTTKNMTKGWKVGDDVTNLTRAGNEPSWSTVRQRYWKNEAYYNPTPYTPANLNRMQRGLAPLDRQKLPMHLHHPYGREGNNFYIFEPMTQSQHIEWHNINGWRFK